MGAVEKELLTQAMASAIGIEISSTSPDRDFMRLSQERTKNPFFKPLTIRRRPRGDDSLIWVGKVRAEAKELAAAMERAIFDEGEGDDFPRKAAE